MMKPTTTTKMKIEEKFAFHCLFFCWGFHVVNKASTSVGAKNKEWKSLFHFSEICMRWVLEDLHDFAVILCGRKFSNFDPITFFLLRRKTHLNQTRWERKECESDREWKSFEENSKFHHQFLVQSFCRFCFSVVQFLNIIKQSPGRINFSFRQASPWGWYRLSTHTTMCKSSQVWEGSFHVVEGNW